MLWCVPYACLLRLSSSFVMQIYLQKNIQRQKWRPGKITCRWDPKRTRHLLWVECVLHYLTVKVNIDGYTVYVCFFSFRQEFQTRIT